MFLCLPAPAFEKWVSIAFAPTARGGPSNSVSGVCLPSIQFRMGEPDRKRVRVSQTPRVWYQYCTVHVTRPCVIGPDPTTTTPSLPIQYAPPTISTTMGCFQSQRPAYTYSSPPKSNPHSPPPVPLAAQKDYR